MPVLARNKKAKINYEILDVFEAGLELRGHEVKSLRGGSASLKEAYISVAKDKTKIELFLVKTYIPLYQPASGLALDYDPLRPRKLLLKSSEIQQINDKLSEQGLTLIPLKIYTKNGFLKLEFALARGLKKHDKRELIRRREVDRRLKVLTKRDLRN